MTDPAGNSPEESREAEGMFATAMQLVSDRPRRTTFNVP